MKTTPRVTDLSLFNREAHYLNDKAREVLGYQPCFDVSRGLNLSVGWLKIVGLVDHQEHGER